MLKYKMRNYNSDEIRSELLIPLLTCAKSYKDKGVGFHRYLYKVYKYELKRHIDGIKWDTLDYRGLLYKDIPVNDRVEEEIKERNDFSTDEEFSLSDPRWIYGERSKEPFSSMKPHERYILAKYYYEGYTDREIARMLPYNPKSIHRIRMRLTRKLFTLYEAGELNSIRL